jgi:hypothetical protein
MSLESCRRGGINCLGLILKLKENYTKYILLSIIPLIPEDPTEMGKTPLLQRRRDLIAG